MFVPFYHNTFSVFGCKSTNNFSHTQISKAKKVAPLSICRTVEFDVQSRQVDVFVPTQRNLAHFSYIIMRNAQNSEHNELIFANSGLSQKKGLEIWIFAGFVVSLSLEIQPTKG